MNVSLLSTSMRYFVAVADAGSVSRAASQLHVAGSAVSRQVASLEASLGVALFERRQRGMHLTPAGERLAAHLRLVAEEGTQALETVRGQHATLGRKVRIACTEGFVVGFIPAAMARFREAQPDVLLQFSVVLPDEAVAQVQRREADLALIYRVLPAKGCEVHHDSAAPLVALMRADHPLARRRSVTVAEVAACPLLLNERGTTSRQLFELACSLRGLRCEPVVVGNALAVLLPMVRDREVLMTGYLTAAHVVVQGGLVARPFARGELASRRLQLLSLQGRRLSPMVQQVSQALVAAIRTGSRRPPVAPA